MEIKFKKLIPEAQTPFRKYEIDAGFDLYCTSIEETKDYIQYNTGVAVEIPEGYVGLIFPRSSVTTYDLMLKNSVGVIDASYRGEIMCRFYETEMSFSYIEHKNVRTKIYQEHLSNKYVVGDRVAQIVFIEIPKITLIEVPELSETQRNEGGFGSTGK